MVPRALRYRMRVHLLAATLVVSTAQQLPPPTAPLSKTDPPPFAVNVTARAMQPGEVVRLDIASTRLVNSLTVQAFDRNIAAARVGQGAWRALIGIDLDVTAGEYPVTIDVNYGDGTRTVHEQTLTVEPKEFPTRAAPRRAAVRESAAERAAPDRPGAPPAGRAVQGCGARAALDGIVSPPDRGQRGVGLRRAQRLQRRAARAAQRRRLCQPQRHAGAGAGRRSCGAGRAALLHGTDRDDRPRCRAGVAAGAPVADRRARGG